MNTEQQDTEMIRMVDEARKEAEELPFVPEAKRAMDWGVYTWLWNVAGCLLGMVPLALPLSVIVTIVTLLTGIGAMILGVRGVRVARRLGRKDAARQAWLGFALGAAHLLIVCSVIATASIALNWDKLWKP